MEKDVVADDLAGSVHQVDANRIVAEHVLLDEAVARVHEVQAVTPALNDISSQECLIGVPDDYITAVAYVVIAYLGTWTIPELNAVTTLWFGERLPHHKVPFDKSIGGVQELDAEEAVKNLVADDLGSWCGDKDAGVLAVVIGPAAADDESLDTDIRCGDMKHSTLPAAIDCRPVLAVQRKRAVDDDRAGIDAATDTDRCAGRCGGDGFLDITQRALGADEEFAGADLGRRDEQEHRQHCGENKPVHGVTPVRRSRADAR